MNDIDVSRVGCTATLIAATMAVSTLPPPQPPCLYFSFPRLPFNKSFNITSQRRPTTTTTLRLLNRSSSKCRGFYAKATACLPRRLWRWHVWYALAIKLPHLLLPAIQPSIAPLSALLKENGERRERKKREEKEMKIRERERERERQRENRKRSGKGRER